MSGGTRTTVKTTRPWQVRMTLPANQSDCPLCSREQIDEYIPEPGWWKTFENSNTPWPYHRLLIPAYCWPIDKLWSLGGKETLETMLRLAIDDVVRTRGHLFPIWIYTHIGYGAGQNLPHLHWHICEPPTKPKNLDCEGLLTPLWSSDAFSVHLGGTRAGQAFIFPKVSYIPQSDLSKFATESWKLVEMFNNKFNQPDYCLFIALHSETEWWARYTPILNNWGGSEFAALDLGTPFVLPWPHEATRDFLLAP